MSSHDRPGWGEERIRAAYRRMATGGHAPDEATSAVLAEIETGAVKRSGSGPTGRVRLLPGALGGLAAALLIVCVVGVVLLQRSTHTAGTAQPSSVATASANALPTMTVSQALRAIGAGGLTSTDLLAVDGWLQPDDSPPMSCPTFTQDEAFGLGCGGEMLSLAEKADGGSSIQAVVLAGTTLPDGLSARPDRGVQVVLVGHIHDLRASLCSTAAQAHCESALVVDQIASFDGKSLGPSVAILRGESNPSPRMSQGQVSVVVAAALQPGSTVVSMTAVTLIDAYDVFSPGLAPSGEGEKVVWYVRVTGPAPLVPLMPRAHAGNGLLVLDDATGAVTGGAGWGWDPAKAGASLPDGTVTLHTTNWLASQLCGGVGLDAVLRGSRADPRVAWLENKMVLPSGLDTGPSLESKTLVWPAGYRARFTPKIEIIDGTGTVVLRDGDPVGGACGVPDDNSLYLQPPFN